MRRIAPLALFFTLLIAESAVAAERVPARVWRRVKTYDMPTLQKIEPLPMRHIVGVRFNYRQSDIRHLKPNWHYGSIWRYRRAGGKDQFDHIPVMVADADLPAFQRISTNSQSGRNYVAYGQVLQDAEAHFLFLRLLGTKVRRDSRGNATVSW